MAVEMSPRKNVPDVGIELEAACMPRSFLGFFSDCLRAKNVSVSHSHFNSQECQTLLLKESEP